MLLTAIKTFLLETLTSKSCSALLAFLSISVKYLREFLKELIEAIYLYFFFFFVLIPFPFFINLKISVEDLLPITFNTLYYSLDFIFWQSLIKTQSLQVSHTCYLFITCGYFLLIFFLPGPSNNFPCSGLVPFCKGTKELQTKLMSYAIHRFYNHGTLLAWRWCDNRKSCHSFRNCWSNLLAITINKFLSSLTGQGSGPHFQRLAMESVAE